MQWGSRVNHSTPENGTDGKYQVRGAQLICRSGHIEWRLKIGVAGNLIPSALPAAPPAATPGGRATATAPATEGLGSGSAPMAMAAAGPGPPKTAFRPQYHFYISLYIIPSTWLKTSSTPVRVDCAQSYPNLLGHSTPGGPRRQPRADAPVAPCKAPLPRCWCL